MALMRCKNCNRFFGAKEPNKIYCSNCTQANITGLDNTLNPDEQKFLYARNIVYDFPDISPVNLVKKMQEDGIDISISEVMKYVKQGRLILKGVGEGEYCSECGTKILSGRMCPLCTKKFENAITNVNEEEEKFKKILEQEKNKPQGPRMYTRD